MTVALFSPDPAERDRLQKVGIDAQLYPTVATPSEQEWQTIDVVILDLQLFRVSTSDTQIPEDFVAEQIRQAASNNPDAFWLLVSLPGSMGAAYRLRDGLFEVLRAAYRGAGVSQEPHSVTKILPIVKPPIDEIQRIEDIPIEVRNSRALEPQEMRCVRRLLKDVDGALLEPFGDGRGDAIVFKVACSLGGAVLPPRILKVGPATAIKREHANYEEFVRYKVGGYRFPHHDSEDVWFAGRSGALSYSIVGGDDPATLVEVMRAGDGSPALNDLFDHVLPPWLAMEEASVLSLRSLVNTFLSPVSLDDADQYWASDPDPVEDLWNPLPWLRDVTNRVIDVDVPTTIVHGDLHGLNIVVDSNGQAWLVDFYKTGRRVGLFDFAFCDVMLLLHKTPGMLAAAIDLPLQELMQGERASHGGGHAGRPELDVIRRRAIGRWGVNREGAFQIARGCIAIRLMQYPTTDKANAKIVASLAVGRARELHPEWELQPLIGTVAF